MEPLACHGGPPSVTLPAPHYCWPVISDRTRAAVLRQLDESISIYDRSGVIERLERRLEAEFPVGHAVLYNSGTSALHAMYAAVGVGQGDEVVCPAYTFFATASPLFHLGAVPVLADCGPSGNVTPEEIAKRLTSKTKAVVVTHMWGVPCDMAPIVELCRERQLTLLEDISHAYGATYRGKAVGTFGKAAALSLQGQKTLTGGEGGVLLTGSDEVYFYGLAFGHYNKRCRNEIDKRHPLYEYAVTGLGLKLRIHPVAAAIALEQLESLPGLIETRRAIANRIRSELAHVDGVELPPIPPDTLPSWYALTFLVSEPLKPKMDELYTALVAEGCVELDRPRSTAPLQSYTLFINPSRWFPSFPSRLEQPPAPTAYSFFDRAFKLPVWHDMDAMPLVTQYLTAIRKVFSHFMRNR